MKVHILDDWFDTLRGLPCFSLLDGHEVTVWTDHAPDEAALADRLHDAEALVLFRERTKVTRGLLQRLPNLRLISQRSVYPHVDVPACTDTGVLLCSNMHSGTPSYAAAELTFGLILAAMRQIPQQMASARAGHWQMGVGKTLRGRTLGLYGYGRIAGAVADYARALPRSLCMSLISQPKAPEMAWRARPSLALIPPPCHDTAAATMKAASRSS